MKIASIVLPVVLIAVGLLWVLQGLGHVGGSFMTGQTRWFNIGLVVMAAGIALLFWSIRRR